MIENMKLLTEDSIYQHPDNPRKDLGDLTELSESIRKKGIMQNLTVIPGHWDKEKSWHEDGYTLLMGHRRFAAGKVAGVKEFLCKIITNLDQKEQVSAMLEENMQRDDLTIWEQANGFQMLLDLGDTEEQIAEKTGFSKSTIRHRLNIAKLDSQALREKERQDGYQLSLMDLYELEKIKDVKTRDKILKESKDSRDMARLALNAQAEQTREENKELYAALLEKEGIQKAPKEVADEFYSDKWEHIQFYELDKKPSKQLNIKDGDQKGLFYLERYGRLYIVRKAKKVKKVLTPEEAEKRQKDKNKKQIRGILKEAASTRKVFIKGILSGKISKITDEKKVEAELFNQMLDWESVVGTHRLLNFFIDGDLYYASDEEINAAKEQISKLSILQKMLCLVSSMIAETELVDYHYKYVSARGVRIKAFYSILEQYGFQFSNDEEKEVIEGTSSLYEKD